MGLKVGTGASERIDTLYARATAERAAFEPPGDPPDEERALRFLREGVGQALAVYIEGRTGERVRFDPEEFGRLERAMNAWFECYAGCYGIDIDATFTLRAAAEALLDTHELTDVARVLTKVPTHRGVGPTET